MINSTSIQTEIKDLFKFFILSAFNALVLFKITFTTKFGRKHFFKSSLR